MATLNVPEGYREGIANIGKLSDDEFLRFFSALQTSPEFNDSRELSAWLDNEVPGLTTSRRDSILRALSSMSRAQSNSNAGPKEFANDVWVALSHSSPELITELDQLTLEKRLSTLLEHMLLNLPAAKADDLRGEVERNYCDARIMTDLRPSFRKTVDDSISMMVVLHNLRIGYHDDSGEHREFYVALDTKGLRDLQKTVERAQKKTAAIKEVMKKSNISVVD